MNNDLISREALKKQVQELLDLAGKRVDDTPNNSPCYRMYVEQENERARFIKLIDNAPTIEPQKVLVANVTFDKEQLEQLVRDRVIEPIKNVELVLQTDERPHGEWQEPFESNGKTYHKCNHCHISSELILFDNFCPHCGANMKGGGASE